MRGETLRAPHLSMLAAVDDADDVRNRDTRLGDVGRDDDLAHAWRRGVEDGLLPFRGDAAAERAGTRQQGKRHM